MMPCPGKRQRKREGCFLFMLLFLYLFPLLPLLRESFLNQLSLRLGWYALLLFFLYALLPRTSVSVRGLLRRSMRMYAISGAGIFIALRFVTGVILKSLKLSPYDHSLQGILKNILELLLLIAVRESIRSYGIGTIRHHLRWRRSRLVLLTLFFALCSVNFSRFLLADGVEGRFVFVAKELLPAVSESALLSCFVYCGGSTAAILYAGALSLFLHLFPYLPELPWLGDSAIGLSFPLLYLMFLLGQYRQMAEYESERAQQGFSTAYLIELFLAVLFYWFCVGVFPVYPSVILTGSMEPGIDPGDIVLVRRIVSETEIRSLVPGDIIHFKREDITITHRILKKEEDEAGNLSFITKGDNNVSEDTEPVLPNDIRGQVVRVLPKAGLPVLFLHSGEETPEEIREQKAR